MTMTQPQFLKIIEEVHSLEGPFTEEEALKKAKSILRKNKGLTRFIKDNAGVKDAALWLRDEIL